MKILHDSWHELSNHLNKVTAQFGSTFYDTETGQTLDVGQALCRTVYGPDWQNDETFKAVDQQGSELPAPEAALNAAESWANGTIPDWLREQE